MLVPLVRMSDEQEGKRAALPEVLHQAREVHRRVAVGELPAELSVQVGHVALLVLPVDGAVRAGRQRKENVVQEGGRGYLWNSSNNDNGLIWGIFQPVPALPSSTVVECSQYRYLI